MTTYESQAKLDAFNTKLKECKGCTEKFTISGSFNSWYDGLKEYAQKNNAVASHACKDSWSNSRDQIIPAKFMPCLNAYLAERGNPYGGSINMDDGKTKITSFK